MAKYPIKMLKDEENNPFIPLVSTEGIQSPDGETLEQKLQKKLEKENIIAGSNITISTEGNNITINSTGGSVSANLIDNLTTEVAGQGALDARQGKILKDSIPQVINNLTTVDTNNALSAYQGYLLDHKFNDYAAIDSLAKIATTGKAEDVYFKDGDNIQDKYDTGELSKKYYILDDLPIGAQFAYSSATNIPEGCLICDGSAVSRTDYSELFAVIGTTYGEGDGSTTFNLPNKRGRVSVGLDTTQTEFNSLGKHIGEKTHTLTIDEIPSHRHPYGDYFGIAGGTKFNVVAYNDVTSYPEGGTVATGGGQSHNNIQPSEVDIWLIKAKQKATNQLPNAAIYNGLDSTSITNALSANMGRVLNDKIIEYINKSSACAHFSINENIKISKDTAYGGTQVPFDRTRYSYGDVFTLNEDGKIYCNTNAVIQVNYCLLVLEADVDHYTLLGANGRYVYTGGPGPVNGIAGSSLVGSFQFEIKENEYITLMLGAPGTFTDKTIMSGSRLSVSIVRLL